MYPERAREVAMQIFRYIRKDVRYALDELELMVATKLIREAYSREMDQISLCVGEMR